MHHRTLTPKETERKQFFCILFTKTVRLASVQEIRITKNIHFNTINENSSLIASHEKNQISWTSPFQKALM